MSKVRVSLIASISGKTDQVPLCLWRRADQVCLGQKGIIWHPRVGWKFLEARFEAMSFHCTGCKS